MGLCQVMCWEFALKKAVQRNEKKMKMRMAVSCFLFWFLQKNIVQVAAVLIDDITAQGDVYIHHKPTSWIRLYM